MYYYNEYVVYLEKLMTSEVGMTYWAPNMDILAIITFDNMLELYRINYKAQKVFYVEENKPIKCLSFSPDGHLIAYGTSDGVIKVVKTENGEKVVIVDNVHSAEIYNLNFQPFCRLKPNTFLPFQKGSIESKLILNISPHKNCNKNAIIKINYFNDMTDEFFLLLSSEYQRTVLLINGFIQIAYITYAYTGLNNFRVLHCHFDQQFWAIVGEQVGIKCNLHLIQYPAQYFSNIQYDIIKFNTLIAYINEILAFVEVTYDSAYLMIRDILRQYGSKINLIDDGSSEHINPCKDLFRYLNSGVTSSNLNNFFGKEIYDSKILEKLDEGLNGVFSQLHDLLLESTQNSFYKATIFLNKLISLAEIEKFRMFGLRVYDLRKVQQGINRLYTMGYILLIESTYAKFDIRNLLVWLNKATIKLSVDNEVEIENSKSYLNRYTVDFNRLHSFIADYGRFRLLNLVYYFGKTNQAYPMVMRPPEFKLYVGNTVKQASQQYLNNYTKLARLLYVSEYLPQTTEKMEVEYNFKSFKLYMKDVTAEWNLFTSIPIKTVSKILAKYSSRFPIGQVYLTEVFQFEIKTIVRKGYLILYYVYREYYFDVLVEYNCHRRIKKYLKSTRAHILSLAIAEGVIAVTEDKRTGKKLIVQVANEEFDGGEIVIGKRITKVEGELDINSSLKGLNSLIEDKNKLIVFD